LIDLNLKTQPFAYELTEIVDEKGTRFEARLQYDTKQNYWLSSVRGDVKWGDNEFFVTSMEWYGTFTIVRMVTT